MKVRAPSRIIISSYIQHKDKDNLLPGKTPVSHAAECQYQSHDIRTDQSHEINDGNLLVHHVLHHISVLGDAKRRDEETQEHEDFGKYEVVTPYNNESYPLYFSKLVNRETTLIEEKERPCIIGLYVDIFPLDATDDDLETAKALYRKYSKTINRLNAVTTHNTFIEYISLLLHKETWGRFAIKTIAFFCRSKMRHRLIQQMDEMSHRYDFDKAKNVLVNTGSYHYKEIFPKEWLGKGKEFPFEDTTVLLPEQADTYLRHFFGDYMKFPPVEQRVEKHLRYYLNMEKRETWDEIKRKL